MYRVWMDLVTLPYYSLNTVHYLQLEFQLLWRCYYYIIIAVRARGLQLATATRTHARTHARKLVFIRARAHTQTAQAREM